VVLSLHPVIQGDENRIIAGRDPGDDDIAAMKRAEAVIVSQGVTEEVYKIAVARCRHVFPNYDARFAYPGKDGQARLFTDINIPHPQTVTFDHMGALSESKPRGRLSYPFVIKHTEGGEGRSVFLVDSRESLSRLALGLGDAYGPIVAQEYVPTGGRDLRVVTMFDRMYAYWRVQRRTGEFRTNLSAGAEADWTSDPDLMARGKELAELFSRRSGANLVAMDVLFPLNRANPLALEVNYFFGRQGFGGSAEFYNLLKQAVQRWLRFIGVTA